MASKTRQAEDTVVRAILKHEDKNVLYRCHFSLPGTVAARPRYNKFGRHQDYRVLNRCFKPGHARLFGVLLEKQLTGDTSWRTDPR
jgi:hypothetical protein